ncbi:hypothetical protein FE784_20290 [Paenibacillus hemerocallicola]|uniref:Amidohydrolase-related domain-containing protein n=1 Tax=Paenibacillus hemerocallicola TaxID=1172614 RepID=A0A5C4T5V6_9BACL|nr:amidohydrolase family protein [Paenibacillus hemerocallicola]TNJ64464.1 hypothetical protein FE784_20290 [Paenibacillus hemerocallicola]
MMHLLEPFVRQQAVDLTAFIGQWPTRLEIRAGADDLSAMADKYGLEGICVSHIASVFGFDTRSGNEALFAETAADGRLWPVAILNPAEAAWDLELEWAVQSGVRGIRLVPGYHDYSLLIPQVGELAGRLNELGLPLHVSARLEDDRLQHPRFRAKAAPFHELAELLRLCGDLPVVISGLKVNEWDRVKELLNDGHHTERVLLDLWFTNGPLAAIAALCRSGQMKLAAYGSCTPIQVMEATALQLASANISDSDRAALCRGNARRLLG